MWTSLRRWPGLLEGWLWFSEVLPRLDPGLGCLGAVPEVVALVAGFTISCDRIGSTRASKAEEHRSFAIRFRTVASHWPGFQRNADVHGLDGRLAEWQLHGGERASVGHQRPAVHAA